MDSVNPLNTNTNEINSEPFGIDAGSLQMQLLDLKTKELWLVASCFLAQEPAKDLWNGKFTELKSKLEELESRNACPSRSTSGQL
ncbi:hypothetical protein AVEN_236461-1 [Araneus ventricosus]|uniref:Uncharacterized protein n=1 Tax=Araneus ventricosus TaxID=182803 RepID=A0A4Y2ITR2_ARAVE|nr:hypothetical protein AVEN_236461-1 [Araneus ventricosus]